MATLVNPGHLDQLVSQDSQAFKVHLDYKEIQVTMDNLDCLDQMDSEDLRDNLVQLVHLDQTAHRE